MPPVPGQEFVEAVLRRPGDAGEHIGEPGPRIDTVEPGGADRGVHGGRAPAVAVGAGEQSRSATLIQAIGDWLKQKRARVSSKSRLGEKLAHIARHWVGLRVFLADGRVEMDGNSVENLAKLIALNRKNALFAGHDEGAAAWGRIASPMETGKLNGPAGLIVHTGDGA